MAHTDAGKKAIRAKKRKDAKLGIDTTVIKETTKDSEAATLVYKAPSSVQDIVVDEPAEITLEDILEDAEDGVLKDASIEAVKKLRKKDKK